MIAHVSDDPNEALLMCRYDVPAFFGRLPEMLQKVYSRIPLNPVPEGQVADNQYEDIVGQYFYLNSDDPAIEEWDVEGILELSEGQYRYGQLMAQKAVHQIRTENQLNSGMAS